MEAGARSVRASAPTRIDFGGGWTDVPPYPEERGGFVCNLAIERRAITEVWSAHAHPSSEPESPLVAAALRRAGMPGIRVRTSADFPIGAGLGGSSAAGVALAAALAHWRGAPIDAPSLAEWSRATEVDELGIAGGRQDHYAAALGGALALRFDGSGTDAERIPLAEASARRLASRCLLAYTGESRMSGDTITAVLDAYRDRRPRVVEALDRMRDLARTMAHALGSDDVDGLAAAVDEHWHHQRALHPAISTERIDALEREARAAGAVGMKALGASGGGCVIVFRPDDDDGRVAAAVSRWATLLPWRVATDGVTIHAAGRG